MKDDVDLKDHVWKNDKKCDPRSFYCVNCSIKIFVSFKEILSKNNKTEIKLEYFWQYNSVYLDIPNHEIPSCTEVKMKEALE